MLAFGWFKNGFTLEDSTTTATFASAFPVSGAVALNGGTLYLDSDLHFTNAASFSSFGNIYAYSNTLVYDSANDTFADPNNIGRMYDIDLITKADLSLSGTLWFEGNCSFVGSNRKVTLDATSQIVIGHNSTLYVKGVNLIGLQRNNVRCFDDTGKIVFDDVNLIMADNYSFTNGIIECVNSVDVTGTYTFFYETTHSLSVHANSDVGFYGSSTVYFGKQDGSSDQDNILLFYDLTSKLILNNAKAILSPCGIRVTRGSLLKRLFVLKM